MRASFVGIGIAALLPLSTRPALAEQPAPPPATTTLTDAPATIVSVPSVPPGTERITVRAAARRPNGTLLGTGAGMFALGYGVSVVSGLASHRDADKKLFIPLVGPWLDIGDRGCSNAVPCGVNEDLARIAIVASGVIQSVGAVIAIASFVVPGSTTRYDRTTIARARPHVSVVPISYAAGAGLGAVGTF